MKIHLLSDLHLETGDYRLPDGLECNVIAAVGDIAPGTAGVKFLKTLPWPVLYVPGNHEFWPAPEAATNGGGETLDREDYRKRLEHIRSAAAGSNVHVLDCDAIVIGGVRFLGTTLWTNYGNGHPALMRIALQRMRDYYKIGASRDYATEAQHEAARRFLTRVGCDPSLIEQRVTEMAFLPLHARALHRRAMRFLRRELAKPFDGETVILSHHAPTWEALKRIGLAPRYFERRVWTDVAIYNRDSPLYQVACYASDLDPLLAEYRDCIDLWCFGHLHHALDFVHEGVRCVSNPRGYYHGPFTAKSVGVFGFWGIAVSEDDIAKSQAYFRARPYEGDGMGFERSLIIDTEAGLVPPLARLIDEAFERVRPFKDEFERFAVHVLHPDAAIREACQEAALKRVAQITEALRPVALEVLRAIGLFDRYDRDGIWALNLVDLLTLSPNHSPSFEPVGGEYDPKYARKVLSRIRQAFAATERTMRELPCLPQLGHRIVHKALITLMRELEQQGMGVRVRGWAARKRVLRLPCGPVADLRIELPKTAGSVRPEDSESRRADTDFDTDDAIHDSIEKRFDELIGSRRMGLDWRRRLQVRLLSPADASREDTEGWMALDEFKCS